LYLPEVEGDVWNGMRPATYFGNVNEVTDLIRFGRKIGADMQEVETLLRGALHAVADGDDVEGVHQMRHARVMAEGAIRSRLSEQYEAFREEVETERDLGAPVNEATALLVKAKRALEDEHWTLASRRLKEAGRALQGSAAEDRNARERLHRTGWLIGTLERFEEVTADVVGLNMESIRARSDGNYHLCLRLDDEVCEKVLPRLFPHLEELLDEGQRRLISLRSREVDPARLTMSYRSAADYLEMARRRHDRGTPDDMRVALEYLRELEELFTSAFDV
jgi:hypothetical protein